MADVEAAHPEIIGDNLSKAGWSWGSLSGVDSDRRTIFVPDAHPRMEDVSLCVYEKS